MDRATRITIIASVMFTVSTEGPKSMAYAWTADHTAEEAHNQEPKHYHQDRLAFEHLLDLVLLILVVENMVLKGQAFHALSTGEEFIDSGQYKVDATL